MYAEDNDTEVTSKVQSIHPWGEFNDLVLNHSYDIYAETHFNGAKSKTSKTYRIFLGTLVVTTKEFTKYYLYAQKLIYNVLNSPCAY